MAAVCRTWDDTSHGRLLLVRASVRSEPTSLHRIQSIGLLLFVFFFSSRRRHTRFDCDWSSDVCSSDLARDQDMKAPRHWKPLVADEVRFILERDPRLLVPVGTCEQHGPHLPLGCDTIIVERLADDLSASFDILRAPTIEYGVNTATQRPYAGNATVRRKTLHRWMNDLLGSWEQTGVDAFIILTAHGHDPHQEALSTLRTRRARVFTVDVFALDFGGHLADPDGPMHGSELDTSLLLYLAPQLVRMERAQDFVLPARQTARYRGAMRSLPERSPGSLGRPTLATPEKGERLYKMIYERIATRVLGAPVPPGP